MNNLNILIITSAIFSSLPEIVQGVSTRNGGISPEPFGMNLGYNVGDDSENVKENRRRYFSILGINEHEIVYQKQVHSTTVTQVQHPGIIDSCDAIITKTRGIFLAVSVADCLPIFIYDSTNQVLAAVHAGWRGSKEGIVSRVMDLFIQQHRSDPANLVAYIGPGAGACCYEVREDVANQFSSKYLTNTGKNRTRLNLKMFNQHILTSAGIPVSKIEVSHHCTICNPKLFHSYRRDGSKSGRMLAVIGMRNHRV
ncbi:MAG: peptidoglycan editing factor PgeF [Bacteroidota bacterium]